MKLHVLREDERQKLQGTAVWGAYWPRGAYQEGQNFGCLNAQGEKVPMNSRVTAYWPDGSLKWTAHCADAARLGETIEIIPTEEKAPAGRIQFTETAEAWLIRSERLALTVPKSGPYIIRELRELPAQGEPPAAGIAGLPAEAKEADEPMTAGQAGQAGKTGAAEDAEKAGLPTPSGRLRLKELEAVLRLEERTQKGGEELRRIREYSGRTEELRIEERGPVQAVLRFSGRHYDAAGRALCPFILRLFITADKPELSFSHTYIYDADEQKDFLRGLGLRAKYTAEGEIYNRHIKIKGDHGCFHEISAQVLPWHPRIGPAFYEQQLCGLRPEITPEIAEKLPYILQNMPFWSDYSLTQDQANHFVISKKIAAAGVSPIRCLDGQRSSGVTAFGSELGSVMLGIKDFWQKYPSGIEVRGLDQPEGSFTLWFWSPQAEPMDYRHYAERGYNQVYYEGYDYKGGQPQGVGNTNYATIALSPELIPADEVLDDLAARVQQPLVYVGSPEFYHENRVFGFWSLPSRETELENWLEEQLEQLFAFYRDEVEQRNWYGFYNYGDFMHSYDALRHCWKYDMGGYGWDNTELVPTLWLWLYFMRSGRADVFRLAQNLSLHAAEVDVYHLGKYKGLGSRHNVSHWGCPCKEARISMAYHHRYLYYLTGDRRLAELFEAVKDNEQSLLAKDPLGDSYDKAEMVYPTHARSGPDWSSLCSNWLTWWEMTGDERYRDKMRAGMEDIKRAPLRLVSGPDFEFDPTTFRLRYIGERTTGGTHLQICMGAPQIWFEMAEIMEDETWKEMLAEYGRFYYLSPEEQQKASGGLIGEREFTLPFMAAAVAAYGARRLADRELGEKTWRILLETLLKADEADGFKVSRLKNKGNQACLREIPWISTNFAAQFGLNLICALDLIREDLPATVEEMQRRIGTEGAEHFRKA